MLLTITIYIFSTALAFAMIARKIWQLRTGRIIAGSYEEADWTDLSIESIRFRLGELVKYTIHHFVLFALKAWILISYWARRTDRAIRIWLTRILHKNGHLPTGGKPSGFLKNIRTTKDQVADTIQRESSGQKE